MSRLLHLDPSLPVVWRSPESLQIGVDPPQALIDSLDQRFLPVLAALHSGISEEGYEAIASHEGLTPEEAEGFLEALSGALTPRAPDPLPRLCITGSTSHLATFARVLWDVGYRDAEPADEAILVASFVMPASAYHPWLASDVPHTPVILSDQAITVGPRVTPGDGPCLQCVWENRAKAEPALVALATQLSTRSAATDTRAQHALAAWHTRSLLRAQTPGLTYRIDRYTGEVTHHQEEVSSSCLCRSLA
ncbi:MAG TPA: hypothetical protein VGP34_04165 [Pontimonas sp.]|nr:hypothetical protein [Pontimonas sp.]